MHEKLPLGFVWHIDVEKGGRVVDRWNMSNLIPKDGINHIAGAMFGDVAAIGNFYMGLFENNYLPVTGAKASDIPTSIGEFVSYSEASRPLWKRVNTDGVITNLADRGAFTVTAAKRLYGGFFCSVSEKGAGTGLLLSVARFESPKDVEPGMVLRARGEISLIATNIA